ncbi:hypothetical protein FB446DRAFT_824093 [Lentinula raphanica]|nr:hypothetical protein FB446DRAFT_824093 [Lentinula raphanica]
MNLKMVLRWSRFFLSLQEYNRSIMGNAAEHQPPASEAFRHYIPTRCASCSVCKYNDPLYVKVEELDIMVKLAGENNVDALLSGLKEFRQVWFRSRRGLCQSHTAIEIDAAAERCVYLIDTRIIGEYANKIVNAVKLLGIFMDSFTGESYSVQLQTLTAVVKLFLKKPDSSQCIVQRTLNTATRTVVLLTYVNKHKSIGLFLKKPNSSQGIVQRIPHTVPKDRDSPDVRDRASVNPYSGNIYWRLLPTDSGAAKAVVLAQRPPIVAPALLGELRYRVLLVFIINQKRPSGTIGSRLRKPFRQLLSDSKLRTCSISAIRPQSKVDHLVWSQPKYSLTPGQLSTSLREPSAGPHDMVDWVWISLDKRFFNVYFVLHAILAIWDIYRQFGPEGLNSSCLRISTMAIGWDLKDLKKSRFSEDKGRKVYVSQEALRILARRFSPSKLYMISFANRSSWRDGTQYA